MKSLFALTLVTTLMMHCAYAESPVNIINNNYPAPPNQPAPSQNCHNNQANADTGQRPGTYYQSNPNGGNDTVYTTGDKTPYIVDSNCNNQPLVQPYIYGVPGAVERIPPRRGR